MRAGELRNAEMEARRRQIQLDLAELKQDHPYFRGLRGLVAFQQEIEAGAALGPGLNDADRHYNCGRVAGMVDLWFAIQHGTPGGPGVSSAFEP